MHGMNWIAIIVIGVLAGWIASMVVNRHHGILMNLVIGILGSFIGGWLAGRLHIPIDNSFWRELAASAGGAILLLIVLSAFRPRRI